MAKCEIVVRGNLGRDVEAKVSKAGKAYSVLSVGSTPSKKNLQGEWESGQTMWFSVTVFDELNPFEFKKGAAVEIAGVFEVRDYVKNDGVAGYALEVRADSAKTVVFDNKPVVPSFDSVPVAAPALDLDAPF